MGMMKKVVIHHAVSAMKAKIAPTTCMAGFFELAAASRMSRISIPKMPVMIPQATIVGRCRIAAEMPVMKRGSPPVSRMCAL